MPHESGAQDTPGRGTGKLQCIRICGGRLVGLTQDYNGLTCGSMRHDITRRVLVRDGIVKKAMEVHEGWFLVRHWL